MRLIFLTFIFCLGILACDAKAQNFNQPFTLPVLPYGYSDLRPVIDEETMRLHHEKHHQGYVDKLNAEVVRTPTLKNKSLEDIFKNITRYNEAVRNNAGGHWNHSFYWQVMAAPSNTGEASPELQAAINRSFGSMEGFKTEFEAAGTGLFGSGWVWLIVDDTGKLKITTTHSQDNPLMKDAKVKGKPILGNDVWEHAYYLNYQNRRSDYLKNWWRVVNWTKVSENFAATAK